MELLNVFFSALGSLVALFFLTKLIGNRQVSQLSMFDYINGITIGSIAAEMATALEEDFLKPLLALFVYCSACALIAVLTNKSEKANRFFSGKSMVLLDNGIIYRQNLKHAKIDISEFLFLLRNQGYFHLQDIETVILEPNGRISVLETADVRPVCPQDLKLSTERERPELTLILDGTVLTGNLKASGNDDIWLSRQLHEKGAKQPKDVVLATCDASNTLHVYLKNDKKTKRDMFQ